MKFLKILFAVFYGAFFCLLALMLFVLYIYGILPAVFVGMCALLVLCLLAYCSWQFDYKRKIKSILAGMYGEIRKQQEEMGEIHSKALELDYKIHRQQEEMTRAYKNIMKVLSCYQEGNGVYPYSQRSNGAEANMPQYASQRSTAAGVQQSSQRSPAGSVQQYGSQRSVQQYGSQRSPAGSMQQYASQRSVQQYGSQRSPVGSVQQYGSQRSPAGSVQQYGSQYLPDIAGNASFVKTYSVKAEVRGNSPGLQPAVSIYRDGAGVFRLTGKELVPANLQAGNILNRGQFDEMKAYDMFELFEVNSRQVLGHKIARIEPALINGMYDLEKNHCFEGKLLKKGKIEVEDPVNDYI